MKQNKQSFHLEGKIFLETKVCKVSYVGLFEFCSRKTKEIPQPKILKSQTRFLVSQTLDVQEHYSLPRRDEQIPSRLDHAIYVKMGMQW